MKTQRTPQDKKKLDYERKHFNLAEYPHAFRKGWPRKKAIISRAFRRKSRALLQPDIVDIDGQTPRDINAVRRQKLRKWGVIPLKQKISKVLTTRKERIAWNYFKTSYSKKVHRNRFIQFLQALMEGHTNSNLEMAVLMKKSLEPPEFVGSASWSSAKRHDWMRAFFRDVPEWEDRLKNWIETFELEDSQNK